MENNTLLLPDYKVEIFENNNNINKFPNLNSELPIIKFLNHQTILEIKIVKKLYIKEYQPKFKIELKNYHDSNIIKKITYKQFDLDRNLDEYYDNLIEFIFKFIEEMN